MKSHRLSNWHSLITIFLANAILMSIEITAARLIAPHFGLSIVVWSTLISIILLSVSLGSIIGGCFADRILKLNAIKLIFYLVAIYIISSTYWADILSVFISNYFISNSLGAFFTITVLWGPPAIGLGLITPAVFKIKMQDRINIAEGYGLMSASACLGSIFGTLSCGLFLLPFIGSKTILYSCAAIILLLAFSYSNFSIHKMLIYIFIVGVTIATLIGFSDMNRGKIIDTKYSRVIIDQEVDPTTTWINRKMRMDPFLTNTSILFEPDNYKEDPFNQLNRKIAESRAFTSLAYPQYARLINIFTPNAKKILILGGGGYLIPRNILNELPQAYVDVVEIDSGITKIAEKYFKLGAHPRLKNIEEDARVFINKTRNSYEAIFVDVYTSAASPPFWVMSEEALSQMKELITPEGLVITNVIGVLEGEGSRLLKALLKTQQNIFPEIHLFAVESCSLESKPQNFIILAANKKLSLDIVDNYGILDHRCSLPSLSSAYVIRDDFAPVDIYAQELLQVLKQ